MWRCRKAARQQGVSLAVGKAVTVKSELAVSMAAVYPGGSTVPVTVMIVVKYRACLPVGRLIIGVQARQLSDSGSSTVRALGGDSG